MKHVTLTWIVLISALWLVGCGTPRPTTILFLAGGKPILYTGYNEVVRWVGPDGISGVLVTFPVNSPCQDTDPTSTCRIQKVVGYYPYKCDGCSDPGLVVGSDGLRTMLGTKVMAAHTITNSQVGAIYCDKTTKAAKVYPDPLPASASTTGNDSTVQWLPAGGSGIINYSITLQSGTCKEGTTINQSQNVCTLLVGAPANQSYAVIADACSAAGSPVLTIH